jgi:small subunit ribosomal protein S4e
MTNGHRSNVKGRFTIHCIAAEEVTYKLLKVRYFNPNIKANDTINYDFDQGTDFVKFDTGNIVMVTGGRNMGRAGVIVH